MGGFFSKRSGAKKTLLDPEQRQSDYKSMGTAHCDSHQSDIDSKEVLEQNIINMPNTNASQNTEQPTDCISCYLRFLDSHYKELNDESSKGIGFIITQIKRILQQLEESPQQLIIESTLGKALLTLTSLYQL
jgi:hypothetical protein